MANATHIEVRLLPATVQAALKAAGYHRKDVPVKPSETFQLAGGYGNGYRGFAVAINMETGETRGFSGSWGGANPFERKQVDNDDRQHPIPVNGAAFVGQEGGGRPVSGTLYVRPDQVTALLPAADPVSDRERSLLAIFGGIKGGYRREYLDAAGATPEEIDALVARGFLSRNRAGAISITTAGKNARGGQRP